MARLTGKLIVSSMTKRLIVAAAVALALALLSAGSPAKAQTVDCSTLNDVGDRMKCRHTGLLDEQNRLITNLETNFGGVVSSEHFERLKKANTRAKNANNRMDAKKFKSLGKKNQDNQDQNQGNSGDDDTDLAFLTDLEDNYDDVTKNLKTANDLMEDNGEELQALTRPLLNPNTAAPLAGVLAYEPADACKTSVDWLSYGKVMTMTIMKQVAVGLKGIADVADKGCNQDAAGFNAASACIVLEGAAAAMALVVETTDGIFSLVQWGISNSSQQCVSSLSADLQETKATLGSLSSTSSNNSTQLSGIVSDVQAIKTTVNSLTTQVNSLQQQVTTLSGSMNTRFNEVNVLLSTPQGLRTNFPAK